MQELIFIYGQSSEANDLDFSIVDLLSQKKYFLICMCILNVDQFSPSSS